MVGSTGTIATVRPPCSRSSAPARKLCPAPPTASGNVMPSSPALASSCHNFRSKRSSPPSSSFSRSWVTCPSRICLARSRTASCSSEKEKSISLAPLPLRYFGLRLIRFVRSALESPAPLLLPSGHRHAETEHRDEIALHLVHTSAER